MNNHEKNAYRWLPTIGEWYEFTSRGEELLLFEKLGDLKNFVFEIGGGLVSNNISWFHLPAKTWIFVTNVTPGKTQGDMAYLEFLIRRDQEEIYFEGAKSPTDSLRQHCQQIYFMYMFPSEPSEVSDKEDPRHWSRHFHLVKKTPVDIDGVPCNAES